MTEMKKAGWIDSIQRVGAWICALPSATMVTFVIRDFNPLLGAGAVFLIFSGAYFACYLVWYWILFVRPTELSKKLPISSDELRRQRKEFYDNLPR